MECVESVVMTQCSQINGVFMSLHSKVILDLTTSPKREEGGGKCSCSNVVNVIVH